MKYMTIITRTGCLFVEANSESEAIEIANNQLTDTVNWSDDWEVTDIEEDDSLDDNMYITERAF